jgi:fatty acid desaturase
VHLTFGRYWGALLHHIMEHTAHHVDMSVPLYRLKQAQKKLETMLPGRIVIQRFSWRWYFDARSPLQAVRLQAPVLDRLSRSPHQHPAAAAGHEQEHGRGVIGNQWHCLCHPFR